MRYDDFTLQVDTSSADELRVRVLRSPAGEGSSEQPLPDDLASLQRVLSAGGETQRGSRALRPAEDESIERLSPRATGGRLFEHLMFGRVKTLFDQSLGSSFGAEDRGLRIKLKMDPRDPCIEQLTALPWELLYRTETEEFLALSRRTPVVRYLDVSRPIRPIPYPETLRVLVAMASPHDQSPLNLKLEKEKLEEATAGQARLELSFVENAAASAVRERLVAERSHVLHFMGHGDFDRENREGLLFFEREDGGSDPLSGQALATSLKDLPDLGLVFLNACNTARSTHAGAASPFAGVASALVFGGLPAVLAMQFPITDRAAIRFSQAFYRHLAAGDSMDIALTEGRHAVHVANAKSLEWAIPVLFVRVPDGMIFGARNSEPAAPPVTVPTLLQQQETEPARSKSRVAVAVGSVALVGLGVWAGSRVLSPTEPDSRPKADEIRPNPPDPGPVDSGRKPQVPPPDPVKQRKAKAEPSKELDPATSQAVTTTVPTTVAEEPTTNDPSDLACEWASLTRREPSGLKAEVSCRNLATKKVVISLQANLSDENSSAYSVIGSSLKSKGASFLLEIPPGGEANFSLNFPAPKLGGSQFSLELLPTFGGTIELANPSIGI